MQVQMKNRKDERYKPTAGAQVPNAINSLGVHLTCTHRQPTPKPDPQHRIPPQLLDCVLA